MSGDHVTTLLCSGKSARYGYTCHSDAAWAVRTREGDQWHGACHQHPHQVLKRLGGDGTELVVRDAKTAMAENARLRAQHAAQDEAELLLDELRRAVLDTEDDWDAARAMAALRAEGYVVGKEWGPALLTALAKERVLEDRGEGRYVCIAHLPQ